MRRFIHIIIPIGLLTIIMLTLGFLNMPGKNQWFLGWDALNPEFNVPLNLKRAFTAIWQGNQGLGMVGGHGYAATLPHTFTVWLLTCVIPAATVRYVWTILTLWVGAVGMYLFLSTFGKKIFPRRESFILSGGAFISALFYLLNLGTTQITYIQLEAFLVHFAALPLLSLSIFRIIDAKQKTVPYLFFAVISFLLSTQGFIPPLFLVTSVLIGLILLAFFIARPDRESRRTAFTIAIIYICTNAYWFLPVLYFTFTYHSQIFLSSYNNLMSTAEFIAKSKKFGTFSDLLLMRGLYIDSISGQSEYIFQPWITHLSSIPILDIGYGTAILSLMGIIWASLKRKRTWYIWPFIGFFLFCFIGLAKDIPGLSLLSNFFETIPIVSQAFRTSFTKLILGLGFSYSIFLCIVAIVLLSAIHRYVSACITFICIAIVTALLFIYALPSFQGYLLYKGLIVTLPSAYTDLMSYFKTQDKQGRIANLPQDCAEGWTSYGWGYRGSGFLWYGIEQAIMDRAFDVWSNTNEQYYWELRQILHSQEFSKLDQLFDKYGISWILIDPNVQHCTSAKGFFYLDDLKSYLNSSPRYALVKSFPSKNISPIELYKRLETNTVSQITFATTLPNVQPRFQWNAIDTAFPLTKGYLTNEKEPPDLYIPFRSLTTTRRSGDNEFFIEENFESIAITVPALRNLQGYEATSSSLAQTEYFIPAQITVQPISGDTYEFILNYIFPKLYADTHIISSPISVSKSLGTVSWINEQPLQIRINDTIDSVLSKSSGTTEPFLLYTQLPNFITVQLPTGQLLYWEQTADQIAHILSQYTLNINNSILPTSFTLSVPKVSVDKMTGSQKHMLLSINPLPCDEKDTLQSTDTLQSIPDKTGQALRLSSQNYDQCFTASFSDQPVKSGYLLSLSAKNVDGLPLSLTVINDSTKLQDLHVRLSSLTQPSEYFILTPSYPFGEGRTITIKNSSLNRDPTVNDIVDIGMWFIPQQFMTSLVLYPKEKKLIPAGYTSLSDCVSEKKSNVTYIVQCKKEINSGILIFNQSFDPGWRAYVMNNAECIMNNDPCNIQQWLFETFPLLFGKELDNHVLVNNWANGWVIDNKTIRQENRKTNTINANLTVLSSDSEASLTVSLFFLPQLLEWLGFLLLPIPFLLLLKKNRLHS